MAIALPEHSHCRHCGNPTKYDQSFCDDKCRTAFEEETKKEKIKDGLLLAIVGIALVLIACQIMI